MSRRLSHPAPCCAVIALAAASVHAQDCGQSQIVPNPIFEGEETIPILLTAFSPDSAVGLRNVNSAGQLSIAHMLWDGTAWTVTSTQPIPDLEGGTGWEMRAATGSAPDDLWGAGLAGIDNFHGVPFLARFDGQEWAAERARCLTTRTHRPEIRCAARAPTSAR